MAKTGASPGRSTPGPCGRSNEHAPLPGGCSELPGGCSDTGRRTACTEPHGGLGWLSQAAVLMRLGGAPSHLSPGVPRAGRGGRREVLEQGRDPDRPMNGPAARRRSGLRRRRCVPPAPMSWVEDRAHEGLDRAVGDVGSMRNDEVGDGALRRRPDEVGRRRPGGAGPGPGRSQDPVGRLVLGPGARDVRRRADPLRSQPSLARGGRRAAGGRSRSAPRTGWSRGGGRAGRGAHPAQRRPGAAAAARRPRGGSG